MNFCEETRDVDRRSCILAAGHTSNHHYSRVADSEVTLKNVLESTGTPIYDRLRGMR